MRPRPPGATSGTLWRCPKCGAGFVTPNQWHSCVRLAVDDLFVGRPEARRLYDAFERFAGKVGQFEVIPQKTRIVFLARTRWGGVHRIGKRSLTIGFGLPRRVRHPRLSKVEGPISGWHLHYLRLDDTAQLDAQLLAWLRESYREMGLQHRLGRPKS